MNAPVALTHTARLVDLSDARLSARLDAFVKEQGASLFHRPAWVKAVEAGTGQCAMGIITERLGVLTGWLPFTQVRSFVFGKALVSSGFAVGGGVCAVDENAASALFGAAQTYALESGIPTIELRGGILPSGEGWSQRHDKHCGFERPLEMDDDAQLLAIPRKARAEVRKGLKGGFEVRVGRDVHDLRAHYAVYSESVRNLGTPVFPAALFAAALEAFPDDCDILTVLHEGKPISSVLSFYHNGAVLPFWGGGTFAARAARSNELMYYKLMLHARDRGMTRFDFGRSKTGSGAFKFKKNWGFSPEPLAYAQWTAPGEVARDVDPTSAAYARKIALWKTLPLWLANRLGPLLSRGLA